MSSYTQNVPDMQAQGPVSEVKIAVPHQLEAALTSAGGSVASPIQVSAMIDTGASSTLIQEGIAQSLGLNPVGVTNITTPTSVNKPCHIYYVRIIFPYNIVQETTAVEAPLKNQNIRCLIGRDILADAVLVYIGYTNQFTISV